MRAYPTIQRPSIKRDPRLHALLAGRLHDPFSFLGAHAEHGHWVVRAFHPHAASIWINTDGDFESMTRTHPAGVFEWRGLIPLPRPYQLRIEEASFEAPAYVYDTYDAYAFPPQVSEHDLYLFNEGRLHQAYRTLGSHLVEMEGVAA